jgi:predicted RNA-binding Zn ribbon-like protein
VPRAKLDPLTARRFRTGRACLDFVHTGGVGRWLAAELVHDAGDLAQWLAYVLDVERVVTTPADVGPAKELRDVLWALAQQRIGGDALDPTAVELLDAFAAEPPPVPRLAPDGETRGLAEPVTAAQALSALARDAIDLFSGPLGHRIRTCASPDCELLFVDASRPGLRRWCSMERCGNRAKTRSYRARRHD